MQKLVTINSRKFDGKIHRTWKCEIIKKTDSLLVFSGIFAHEINHSKLGRIKKGTISYEFYWLDEWFSVFRFHEPDGDLRNFYCNINQPPKFSHDVLDFIDLDIDILVWKDFSFEILDLDEFELNSAKFNYSEELKTTVNSNLQKLLNLIHHRTFPFDYE